MHRGGQRRSTPGVRGGKVRRKNRGQFSALRKLTVDRESPARGFRHVVTKSDVRTFIELLPDWETLSARLERIVLSAGGSDHDGLYESFFREDSGAIDLCAWPEDLWLHWNRDYYEEHRPILETLRVATEVAEDGSEVLCRFTRAQARAFTLLHVFLHELGHHVQRQKMKHRSSNLDEDFAERFANNRWEELYPAYVEAFGDPASDRSA